MRVIKGKYLIGLVCSLAMLSIGTVAKAESYTVDPSGAYTIDSTGVITKYNGAADNKQIVIPSTVGTVKVTGIGDNVFKGMKELDTVVIPDSVVSFGKQAFAEDEKLVKMAAYSEAEIKDGVVTFTEDSPNLVELPASLSTVSEDTFLTCKAIYEFSIDSSNTSFKTTDATLAEAKGELLLSKDGKTLYRMAPGHRNGPYTFPEGIETIGNYACEALDVNNGINMADSVKSIGDYAFYKYNGVLSPLKFNDNAKLETIGDYAFAYTSINTVKFPKTLKSIGQYCFAYGQNSFDLDFSETQIETIPEYAFTEMPTLHELTTPKTLKSIASYAFAGSTNIDTVNFLGDTLESIGSYAFADCRTLHEIEIPKGVTAIEDGTFSGCTNVGTIVLPNTVTSIGKEAFKDCVTIEKLVIPSSVKVIAKDSFAGAKTDNIDTSKSTAAQSMIKKPIPKSGTILVAGKYKYKIVKASKKSGTVSLAGLSSKKNKKKITSLSVPKTVMLNGYKFKVVGIEKNAFSGCTKLKKVTIGANVKTIGAKAFYKCKKLSSVTIKSSKITNVGTKAFGTIKKNATIKCPKKKLAKYKKMIKKSKVAKTIKFKKSI